MSSLHAVKAATKVWVLGLLLLRALPGKSAERPITLFAAGDVLLGRGVVSSQGTAPGSLARFQARISAADIAFCNLECAIAKKRASRGTRLLATPDALRNLGQAGFDVVSTANNHALDNGEAGVRLAEKALPQAGLAAIGTRLGDEPWPVWRKSVRGQRVAVVAASAWGPFHSGQAQVRGIAGTGLVEQVRQLSHKGTLVFVSLHWGEEYSNRPSEGQRRTARALIDGGAAAVLGHHPHVVQPVEVYKGRPIFYSLGNFLFDRTPRPQSGMAALISVDERRVTWRTLGVQTGTPTKVAPAPAPPNEAVWGRLDGRFLKGETRRQTLVWSRQPDGFNRVRLWRLGGAGWRAVAQGSHASIYAMQRGDVDGDGYDEVLLGLNQRSKLDTRIRRRLHIYRADERQGFRPKWRGSALSRPFSRFQLLPREGGMDLVAVETNPRPEYKGFEWIAVYRWNGFGFRLLWDTPVRGNVSALQTGRDAHGPLIRFRQQANGVDRKLMLQPAAGQSGNITFRAKVER